MTPTEVIEAILAGSENMSRPVYRGQADASWPPLSGAVRRLSEAHGEEILEHQSELQEKLKEYHRDELIVPMQVIDGEEMREIQRLCILQHQRAATGLLDFTENALVALWFTCSEKPDLDGKVFMLDIGNHLIARNGRTLPDPLDAEHPVVYYEPDRSLGARIIAQQSIFVICNPSIPDDRLHSVTVSKKEKLSVKVYLEELGISESALFGDIPGLAAANKHKKPLQTQKSRSPTQYRNRGNRAYQVERYDAALSEYELFAAAVPKVAEPHCLIGDALAALGRYERAIASYTEAIRNIERPIYIGRMATASWELVGRRMLHSIYYNRGNAYAAIGSHRSAIEDFDRALGQGDAHKRPILFNRGNSKFMVELFAEAYQDFENAWNLEQRSDTARAMGNCKMLMGEFGQAMARYLSGSASEPQRYAGFCAEDAEQVRQLLERLENHEYKVEREGLHVRVLAQCDPASFIFSGNRGNTGNVPSSINTAPGGKGYGGMPPFSVTIVSQLQPPAR